MISNKFFSNISFYKNIDSDYKVVFSCDDVYFNKYGFYNLLSCDKVGHDTHVHLINPSEQTILALENLHLKNNHSFSFENIDIKSVNYYQLKTYYYCSRFFIANFLLEHSDIKKIIITDADVIFNKKVFWPENIYLGLEYKPEEKHLWRQVAGPVVLVSLESKSFLEDVILDYKNRVDHTDFKILETLTDKYVRGDILGLDQVCMANNIKKYLNDNFLNLKNNTDIKSKNRNQSSVWILTNNNSKNRSTLQKELEEMFL